MFESRDKFKREFKEKLRKERGKAIDNASYLDLYKTLGRMVREEINDNWVATNSQMADKDKTQVHYISMEFLMGRMLKQNLLSIGALDTCQESFKELGIDFDKVVQKEPDPGLGNGGLGRLAADFLDSLSALSIPAVGHCLRFKYGLFDQKIVNGYQVELPGNWLREGNIWEIRRGDHAHEIKFGGRVTSSHQNGKLTFHHEDYESILAVPYDIPIIGYKNQVVNTLRLWNTEPAVQDFYFKPIDGNSCHQVLNYKKSIESISEFLYPDDSHEEGKVLRLKQQYFLVSATLQSILDNYKLKQKSIHELPQEVSVHINDTHPVLAIPELMRILMDEEGLDWDTAFDLTKRTISFTNHTTLPEALESWPEETIKCLLPRIHMIVHELNERFCQSLWDKYPGDWNRIENMAILAHGRVKMAHLALAGSHTVNGVAALHTKLLKEKLFKNFYEYMPEKFQNKTNGITHRRWLMLSNPKIADTVTDYIGTNWITEPKELEALEKHQDDVGLQEQLVKIRHENKQDLAEIIKKENGLTVDPNSIFDVQVKRFHAYKRQLMNALHILKIYNQIKENPNTLFYPRTFIFSGKAAPGYHYAKKIIKLINSIAELVNNDPQVNDQLKIVYLENYRVALAEKIIPASDVNQQISTASKEASGTGNMKFMMNGSIIVGTNDGANIDIREAVGDDNIFVFGLESEEVLQYYHHGEYSPFEIYENDLKIKRILDQLVSDFLPGEENFRDIYDSLLLGNDEYFVLKDLTSLEEAQQKVSQAYQDRSKWFKKAIVNIANSGRFSSDYTIKSYADKIWQATPLKTMTVNQADSSQMPAGEYSGNTY